MSTVELLLLVPLLLQAGTLLSAAAMARSGDAARVALANELQRRQVPLSLLFFAALGVAFHWRAVDAYVVAFAALFVLAQIVHAALLIGGGAAQSMDKLALRASVVALAGLVAMLALDLLPEHGDGMMAP